ncbi:FHF complex subunit HOOK interacting protein 2B isoform X1 [Varanus komodoensis]|nr:FHF complex subunit HOOK interacting protein 2B isoform X1 [Varanus komodoensis]XP_044273353.1 FHF complex subunit HOOK interacting protein 2B isoform X1 [Varanus komodoensis]
MRSQVLLFFSRLLGQMQCPLLHYLSVYKPVQKLLQLGSNALGPEPEKEVMQFVAVLCTKIQQEPALLPYLLEVRCADQPSHLRGAASEPVSAPSQLPPAPAEPSRGLCHEEAPCGEPTQAAPPALNLVTSLIGLCKSQKRKVALKAQENLLLLTSMDHPAIAQTLARDTVLCALLAEHLCALFEAIPAAVSPADVTTLRPASWRLQGRSGEESAFPGQASLEAFFAWLSLCDSLAKEAHPVLAGALSEAVGRRLFLGRLQPQLLQMSERGILLSTALLTGLVKQVRAPALLQELVAFVLGAEGDPARPLQLLAHLTERCRHLSDEISTATLRLFEELLQLPDERVVRTLVLRHLEERGYVLRGPSGQEEPVAREEGPCEDGLELEEDPYFPDISFRVSAKPAHPAKRLGAMPDVKEAVSSFLCLVPSEAKTSAYLEEGGYDAYVYDAEVLFQACRATASHWGWPQASRPLEDCAAGSRFYEGRFLEVLLDRLVQILDQPYAVNLQVTSVLSRLALLPHPHLHEYLLDSYLPLAPGCRNLFSVLIRVIGDLMQRTQRIPDFPANLLLVRKQLMGQAPAEHPVSHQTLLEGVVVLEEFCKELAAIIFVKARLEAPA